MHSLRNHPPNTPARLRILPDGKHIAPAADDDIWSCNERFKIFPHEDFSADFVPLLANRPAGKQVAIDCGSFIGDHASQFVAHGLDTWAIEPFFDSFVCLCYNSPESHNIHAAAGDGRMISLVHEHPGTNHGMRSVSMNNPSERTVRLDDLQLGRVDLLKIDVEGCEEWVLNGAEKIIKAFRPVILIESFDSALRARGSSHEKLEAKLKSLGGQMRLVGERNAPKFDWVCHW